MVSIAVISIFFIIVGFVVIFFHSNGHESESMFGGFLCIVGSLLLLISIVGNSEIERGGKEMIQHPDRFKIEYICKNECDSIIYTDTIVTYLK